MQAVIIKDVQYFPPKFSFAYCSHAWCAVSPPALRDNVHTEKAKTYFCRFAHFLSDDFPLVGVVLLNSGKERSALLTHQHTLTSSAGPRNSLHLQQILRSACPLRVSQESRGGLTQATRLPYTSVSSRSLQFVVERSIKKPVSRFDVIVPSIVSLLESPFIPLLFRSSYFQYLSFVSASAPQPVSKACLFDSS
jgi:hypothetical protein